MKRLLRWIGGFWGLMQFAGLIVAATLAGMATLDYSSANDGWQGSVRREVARSSAIQEEVRTVYGDEAPRALRIIVDERTAAELDPLDATNPLAVTQRDTARDTASSLRAAYRKHYPTVLAADSRYRTADGGANILARLRKLRQDELGADRRKDEPVPDPGPSLREGDAAAKRGAVHAAEAAGASLIVFFFALIYYRPRHTAQALPAVPDLVVQPRLSLPGDYRKNTTVVLALWLVGVVLPLAQLVLGAEEQRSQAAAARLAAIVTSDVASSMARTAFLVQGQQTAAELGVRAAAREKDAENAAPTDADDQREVAAAEDRAASILDRIVQSMARVPFASDRLDPRMAAALATDRDDWTATGRRQQAQTERADEWGDRSNQMVQWTVIGAAAAAVFGTRDFHLGEKAERGR